MNKQVHHIGALLLKIILLARIGKNPYPSYPVLDAFSPFLFYPFSSPPPPPLFCIIYTPAMRIRNTGHHARAVEEKKMA